MDKEMKKALDKIPLFDEGDLVKTPKGEFLPVNMPRVYLCSPPKPYVETAGRRGPQYWIETDLRLVCRKEDRCDVPEPLKFEVTCKCGHKYTIEETPERLMITCNGCGNAIVRDMNKSWFDELEVGE